MDSATAKQKFERLNNITTTLDLNSLDDGSGQVSQQDDPLYLKRVVMSDVALLKMVKHTSSYNCISMKELFKELEKGRKEIGGLFKGKVCGDAFVVMDVFVLPVDHHLDFHSNLLHYFDAALLQTGGLEDVVGWYRTSTIGVFPSATDISTQMRIQKLKDPYFALVIDPRSTIDILKVRVRAFRTYPEGYNHMNRKRNRPDVYLEMFPHLEKRYPLHVTYFKSSLDNSNDAWEIFWNHLISTPKTNGKNVGLEVSENKENLECPDKKNKILCRVQVKREFTKQYSSLTEAVEGLYVKLVKDVGSSESGSKISTIQESSFFVPLTPDEATKLADHECVEAMREIPWVYYPLIYADNGRSYGDKCGHVCTWVIVARGLVVGVSIPFLVRMFAVFGCWFLQCGDRVPRCRRPISTRGMSLWLVSPFKFLRFCGVSAPRSPFTISRGLQWLMDGVCFADKLGEDTRAHSAVLHQHGSATRSRYLTSRSSLVINCNPTFYLVCFMLYFSMAPRAILV